MLPATERDVAGEVERIERQMRGVRVGDSASDTEEDAAPSSATTRPFGSTTGSRFDILVQTGAGEAQGANRRKLVREAARPANASADRSGAVDRRYGTSLAANPSLSQKRLVPQPFSHLLVCDFEATCDAASPNYPHEIIEFPVVCIDTASLAVVAEFHSYVRPTRNPVLTEFCHALTGITQAQVDAAPTLPEVLERFDQWLRDDVYPLCRRWREAHAGGLSRNLRTQQRRFVYDERHRARWAGCEEMVCMATDGPWDMRKFMHECSVLRDGHSFPPLFYRWVNVRHCFAEHFRTRPRKLTDMLRKLGLTFHGHHHSGIDDSRNIARIVVELLARGYRVNHVSTVKYETEDDSVAMSAAARLLDELSDGDDAIGTRRPLNRRGGGKQERRSKGDANARRNHKKC